MITAIDSNVLVDVLQRDSRFASASRSALAGCAQRGGLVVSDVVWAEVAARYAGEASASEIFTAFGVRFVPLDQACADRAGEAWAGYRDQGGPRERILPDFLVGAHAITAADRLLTRDRGFYRSYFSELEIVDPSDEPGSSR